MRKIYLTFTSLLLLGLLSSFQNCSSSLPSNTADSSSSTASTATQAEGCFYDGLVVPSGTLEPAAYTVSQAAVGSSCPSAEALTCNNGSWSTSALSPTATSVLEAYSTCTAAAACTVGSTSMPSGTSVTAYSASSVAYGSSCTSIATTLTCQNGVLSSSSGAASSYTSLACATAAPPGYNTYVGDGEIQALFQGTPQCSIAAGAACFSPGAQCYIVSGNSIGLYQCE